MGAFKSKSPTVTLSFEVTETTSSSGSSSSHDSSISVTKGGSSSSDVAEEFLNKRLEGLKLDEE